MEYGEIWVKGQNVFKGYVGNESGDYIIDDFFDTGDIGFVKNNFLYVKGRKKNILIGDNGKNVAPEELIKKLMKNTNIKDCNIIMKNNRIYAIINTELSEKEVKSIVDEVNIKLPKYKRIYGYEITDKNFK